MILQNTNSNYAPLPACTQQPFARGGLKYETGGFKINDVRRVFGVQVKKP
jgi:hypothetical protein